MANAACLSRLRREVEMLASGPPPGVSCWPRDDGASMQQLRAQIRGPEGSWYEEGTFELDVSVPDRYPFEPPQVRFVTPIFHPNIDDGGRICLDTLKTGPHGAWAPSVNVSTLLTSIRLLMAHPNADDGLMPEITALYRRDPARFAETARARTRAHATGGGGDEARGDGGAGSSAAGGGIARAATDEAAERGGASEAPRETGAGERAAGRADAAPDDAAAKRSAPSPARESPDAGAADEGDSGDSEDDEEDDDDDDDAGDAGGFFPGEREAKRQRA
jgi:ubiquitin-conjugating enzyme E2 T